MFKPSCFLNPVKMFKIIVSGFPVFPLGYHFKHIKKLFLIYKSQFCVLFSSRVFVSHLVCQNFIAVSQFLCKFVNGLIAVVEMRSQFAYHFISFFEMLNERRNELIAVF